MEKCQNCNATGGTVKFREKFGTNLCNNCMFVELLCSNPMGVELYPYQKTLMRMMLDESRISEVGEYSRAPSGPLKGSSGDRVFIDDV